jgi:hypothetical protein
VSRPTVQLWRKRVREQGIGGLWEIAPWVFRLIVTGRFGIVTGRFGNVTGDSGGT